MTASGYTRFVRSTKLWLGLLSLMLILMMLFYPIFRQQDGGVRISFTSTSQKTPEHTAMINPRFHGLDKDNQPYNMIAKSATEVTEDRIDLDGPEGDILLSGGQRLSVKSKTGEFNRKTHLLKLRGTVEMSNNQGYKLVTENILVDVANKNAVTSSEVHGQGPLGTLKAYGGAMADGNNQQIIFEGPVFVTLIMDSKKQKAGENHQ